MKPFYLLFILTFFLGITHSQSDELSVLEAHKWTVKANLLASPYTYNKFDPLPSFFTGIGIKRNFNKFSIRFSYENNQYSYNLSDPNFLTYSNRFGGNSEHAFRLGAEYKRVYEGRIGVNFILDFLYANYSSNQLFSDSLNLPINTIKIQGNAYGGIIGIGIDYYITNNVSIAFESRLDMLYFDFDVLNLEYKKNYSVNYNNRTTDINLRLIGNFSVNYHF